MGHLFFRGRQIRRDYRSWRYRRLPVRRLLPGRRDPVRRRPGRSVLPERRGQGGVGGRGLMGEGCRRRAFISHICSTTHPKKNITSVLRLLTAEEGTRARPWCHLIFQVSPSRLTFDYLYKKRPRYCVQGVVIVSLILFI